MISAALLEIDMPIGSLLFSRRQSAPSASSAGDKLYAGSDGKFYTVAPDGTQKEIGGDVLEFATLSAFPTTGETGKIYVTTGTNKTYRWSGSAYVEIASSPGSTDAVPEGATNLYFSAARAISSLASTLSSYATSAALSTAISGLSSVYTTTAAVAAQITAYGYQTASQVTSAITSALTWNNISGKPSTFTPSAHASTHASGGSDPITIALSQLAQSSATTGQVAKWDGTHWVPSTPPSSNPFDQSLNTTDSVTFAGETFTNNNPDFPISTTLTSQGLSNIQANGIIASVGVGGCSVTDGGNVYGFSTQGFGCYDNNGSFTLNGNGLGGDSYGQKWILGSAGFSLESYGTQTASVDLATGSVRFDGGAITTNGAGNLRFLAGIDQYENPFYTTLNAGGLQFGINAYGDPSYFGVSSDHVYLVDPNNVGYLGASFTSSGISGSTTGNGDTWHLGDAGLLINTNPAFVVASISGTNGSVRFDGLATTPITSDGNGNLNAASLGVAGTYLTNDSGNLLWNGSPIGGSQFNQSLNTTDSPAFNGLTINSDYAQSYLGAAGLGATISSGAFNYAISPGGVSGYNPSVACWGLGESGLFLTAGWAGGTQPTFASISGTDGHVFFDGLAAIPITSDGNGNLSLTSVLCGGEATITGRSSTVSDQGISGVDYNLNLRSYTFGSDGIHINGDLDNWFFGYGGILLTNGWASGNAGPTLPRFSLDRSGNLASVGHLSFDDGAIFSNGFGTLTALVLAASDVTSVKVTTIAKTLTQIQNLGRVPAGTRAFCTNSNTATFNTAVSGTGSFNVPVFYDGTTWRVG